MTLKYGGHSMASGAVYEPYISDFDEISCSCSPLNSRQIDICFTKIGQVLFKISHFEHFRGASYSVKREILWVFI